MTAEETLDKLQGAVESLVIKLENKEKQHISIPKGKKNSHIHILLETNLKEKLVKEAEEKSISIAELCRQKLRDDTQLDRIEDKLNKVLENKTNRN